MSLCLEVERVLGEQLEASENNSAQPNTDSEVATLTEKATRNNGEHSSCTALSSAFRRRAVPESYVLTLLPHSTQETLQRMLSITVASVVSFTQSVDATGLIRWSHLCLTAASGLIRA